MVDKHQQTFLTCQMPGIRSLVHLSKSNGQLYSVPAVPTSGGSPSEVPRSVEPHLQSQSLGSLVRKMDLHRVVSAPIVIMQCAKAETNPEISHSTLLLALEV